MTRPHPSVHQAVTCRFCRSTDGRVALDLGHQPAADHFPMLTDPTPDPRHPLRMWMCGRCGLAQLAEDPTSPEEPRGAEPEALVRQAHEAVEAIAAGGFLAPGRTVAEYGSPHGGSWLGLLAARGLRAADGSEAVDLLVDNIGMMHLADQAAGLAERVARLRPEGVLLFQYHSLASIVRGGQWNALRHGHFAYYSTPALAGMLESVGWKPVQAYWFPLYGGTVLLAATRAGGAADSVIELVAEERSDGVLDAGIVAGLQRVAQVQCEQLGRFLATEKAQGRKVLGYSAASRAVALLSCAEVGPDLLSAVADASPAKHGRGMPGSRIPVISPAELVAARPDVVIVFVEDLLPEVRTALPEIEDSGGRWVTVGPTPEHT